MSDARSLATTGQTRPAPTRADLLARWHAARRRRDAAGLGTEEHRLAVIEVGEIEVQINALDVEASEGREVRPADPGPVRSGAAHHG